eukprot:6375520-Lingulodinium_polyedra.AAC.1
MPGDALMLALSKGGCIRVDAAGERAEIIATNGVWVHIEVPIAAGTRAAEEGATEVVYIRARGSTGAAWHRQQQELRRAQQQARATPPDARQP